MSDYNLIRIPIGDWSDDGHGKFENFDILVPKEFTKEILVENYSRNKEELGFGLKDFAQDYMEGYIPKDLRDKLISAGFTPSEEFSSDFVSDDEEYHLSGEEMLEISLFFLGNGLDDFKFEVPEEPDFYLFGRWSGPESMIGYGIYY